MLAAELPSSPLASFPAIFSRALAFGVLSRRRVLQLAAERTVCLRLTISATTRVTGDAADTPCSG